MVQPRSPKAYRPKAVIDGAGIIAENQRFAACMTLAGKDQG